MKTTAPRHLTIDPGDTEEYVTGKSAANELSSWLPGYVRPETYYDNKGNPGFVVDTADRRVSAYVEFIPAHTQDETSYGESYRVTVNLDCVPSFEYQGTRHYAIQRGVHHITRLLIELARKDGPV